VVEKQGNKITYITCGAILTDKTAAMPDAPALHLDGS